ncbi:MAG: hypothetical protein K2X99_03265 [Gemmatimonadaceae bacterium]|nr:hypothetical protein [Gemmatimonadaceae bacterium]
MRNSQRERTLQQQRTTLGPSAVLDAARTFFVRRNSVYAAFLEQEGPTHLTLRGQGGEEIVLGVVPDGAGTIVSGSSYMFDQQIARFFASLPTAPEVAA